jgi:hypothetical protein
MTWVTSSQLRLVLIRQSGIWQLLLLGQQSLLHFANEEDITQRITADFALELERATRFDLFTPVERKFRSRFLLVAVLGALIVIFLLISELNPSPGPKVLTPLTALLSIVTIIIGLISGIVSMVKSQGVPFIQEEGSTQKKETTRLIDLYNMPQFSNILLMGREQIRNEFGYLDHSVSVTTPLVEYFILRSHEVAKSNTAKNTRLASSSQTRPFFARKSKESSNQSHAERSQRMKAT